MCNTRQSISGQTTVPIMLLCIWSLDIAHKHYHIAHKHYHIAHKHYHIVHKHYHAKVKL